jgi:hypothetical protein
MDLDDVIPSPQYQICHSVVLRGLVRGAVPPGRDMEGGTARWRPWLRRPW